MSPILDIQRTHRRLGKIRMGKTVRQAGKKPYPAKLEQWRLTSPSRDLVAAAAEAYQGEVEEWADAPDGRQWQVFTATAVLPVLIPPTEHGEGDHLADDNVFSQHYEMWSAGGCQRRCPGTGHINEITGKPCECPADPDQRDALAKQGKACKMTTRLSVLLPEIPDIGTWMLETHGYYGAVELGGAIELLRSAAPGRMIPAQVRIDQRSRTVQTAKGPETRRYAVPVLELVTVTTGALMAGGGEALLSGRQVQIGSGGNGRALPAGPDSVPPTLPPLPGENEDSGGGDGAPGSAKPAAAPTPTGSTDLQDLAALMAERHIGKAAVKRIYNEHAERLGEPTVPKFDAIAPGPVLDAAYAEMAGDGGGGEDPPPDGGGIPAPAPTEVVEANGDAPTLPLSEEDPAEFAKTNRRMQKAATEAAGVLNLADRDLLRRTCAWNTTGGRHTSWRDLSASELLAVETTLDAIVAGSMVLRPTDDPRWPEGWQVDMAERVERGEAA